MSEANKRQVAGTHYQSPIQHWDYVLANDIPYLEAQVIKYLTRWRKKNGLEDVYKAKHYLDKLIEVEEAKAQRRPAGNSSSDYLLQKELVKSEDGLVTRYIIGGLVVYTKDGKCMCDCGTECPLGKMGMEESCTDKELSHHNSLLQRKPSDTRQPVILQDGHDHGYEEGSMCEFGSHQYEVVPDYQGGRVCKHCGTHEESIDG